MNTKSRGCIIAIAALVLAGCSAPSDFVRFNNPFAEDRDHAADSLAQRRAAHEERKAREAEHEAHAWSEEGGMAAVAGDDADSSPKPWWKRSNRGDGSGEEEELKKEVASESARDTGGGRAVTILEIEGLRKTAGAVCYPCNGKGYKLREGNRSGDMLLCPSCGGTGRH